MHTKTLWIKEDYLHQILEGRKTVEVRAGYDNIARLQVEDRLLLNDRHPYLIRRIGRYESIDALLQNERPETIAPDVQTANLPDRLRELYPRQKEALGLLALEIVPLPPLRVHFLDDYNTWAAAGAAAGGHTVLRDLLHSNIVLSFGQAEDSGANYHILVGGRPDRRHLVASQELHTLIIPWAGLPAETQALLADFPQLSVHNLHHNAAPVAELALMLMLAAAKFALPYDRALREHDWSMRYLRPGPSMLLSDKTALILGYGAIGRRVARVCRALDMRVVAVKNTVKQQRDRYAHEIHAPSALPDLLPRADVLIICLPLTPRTRDLIDQEALDLLPPGSVLVNVGRGPIVNEGALYEALRSGRLRAAGLDVWYNYPSNEEERPHTPASAFPFHELDNVVMSPHRAGDTTETERLRVQHLARLLNLAATGEDLPDRIDPPAGY